MKPTSLYVMQQFVDGCIDLLTKQIYISRYYYVISHGKLKNIVYLHFFFHTGSSDFNQTSGSNSNPRMICVVQPVPHGLV